ncbi:MAG: 50S ribosomal protein L9 [Patescibacteria group bacterium]
MKIVLIKNDKKLGHIGDIKEVSDGFARNYLIPNKIAKPATSGEVSRAQAMKKRIDTAKQRSKISMETLAERLRGVHLSITLKADESGTFFSKITADKIAELLSEKGIKIKSKIIKLEQPIKKAGNYNINVQGGDDLVQIDLEAKAE